MKFTVIYNVYVRDNYYLTKMGRVTKGQNETFSEMLEREGMEDAIFIFHGWPMQAGEEIVAHET